MQARTRRNFLKGGAVAATGAAIAGFPMIARAQQTFSWKMTSAYPKGAPFYMDGPGSATDLARRIEAMSNGRLKISVYGAGELIPALEGFDAVRAGTVEMNHANSYFWTGKTFAAQYFTAVPFGLNFQGMNGWLYDGGGIPLWHEVYAPVRHDCVPLRQHRRADDRLVQEGDQFGEGLQRAQDAHPGARRQGLRDARRGREAAARRRDLPGARARRDRRRRVRRAVPGPAARAAEGGEVLLHHGLARDRDGVGAAHQQGRVGQAAEGPAGDRRERLRRVQRHQRSVVPAHQRRGDGGPHQEPGRDRAAVARRGGEEPARGDQEGARRGRRQGSGHEEGARFLHGLQGQVQELGRATARRSTTTRFSPDGPQAGARAVASGVRAGIERLVDVVGEWHRRGSRSSSSR